MQERGGSVKLNPFKWSEIMLLEFQVSNFRSIKDPLTLSMQAKESSKLNTFSHNAYHLLRSAVIYGANASGKSNLLKAMAFMKAMVLNQHKVIQTTDSLPHEPFRLSTETENASSQFEMTFLVGDTKYRYGFDADNSHVYSEWLYAAKTQREARLFYRDADDENYVNPRLYKEGMAFYDADKKRIKIPSNQLLLWRCDQNDGEVSKLVLTWFSSLNLLDGLRSEGYAGYALSQLKNPEFKSKMLRLLNSADIQIGDIKLKESTLSSDDIAQMPIPEPLKEWMVREGRMASMDVKTTHVKLNEENQPVGKVQFSLEQDESVGTNKFFHISAPILNTLQEGKVLLIDELDASLHPMLTAHLVRLFNDPALNQNNAQLIFATHDTNLLRPEMFRRDQIWLTEKSSNASTVAFSLSQFKDIRKQEAFERQYLFGKYGGVPYLSKFELSV